MKMGEEEVGDGFKEFLLSGSRDRTLIMWNLQDVADGDEDQSAGAPRKVLTGHSHFISDLDLSQDSRYALSSSWDGTIRLWSLKTASTRKTLSCGSDPDGHKKDVLTVAFSPDNRQIASGSMDKSVKLWNIQGVCKFTVDQNPHTDWVSCVRYFQDPKQPIIVSASWDKTIKVWDNQQMSLMHTFVGHKAQINTLDLAPNTNIIASGSRDGHVNIWNLIEGKHLEDIDVDSPINVVVFTTKYYWLVIGTDDGIRVYDLPNKKFIDKYEVERKDASKKKASSKVGCTSLVFSKDQQRLYAGFTDNLIRVLHVQENKK
jgi:guanine nucleotide-binding protein subunit beta-2-like 1 protein